MTFKISRFLLYEICNKNRYRYRNWLIVLYLSPFGLNLQY